MRGEGFEPSYSYETGFLRYEVLSLLSPAPLSCSATPAFYSFH